MATDVPLLRITLHAEPFEPIALLSDWQRFADDAAPAAAESLFIGRVRATAADGTPLLALELEHYPGMTEAQILRLATAALDRHQAIAARVAHRVGRVAPGEALVLVAVAADRRGQAQRACSELLEALKHDAPFWKKELRADGTGHWLQGNTAL